MYGYDNTCPLLLGRARLHGFPTIGSGFWSWRGIPRPSAHDSFNPYLAVKPLALVADNPPRKAKMGELAE